MCGIIGAELVSPTVEQLSLISNIFTNLQVRGQHAAGYSFAYGEAIQTVSKSCSVENLLNEYPITKSCVSGDKLAFIGHARYSTSTLDFNQPIESDAIAIAHNGVISQADSSTWGETFGVDVINPNDSSLILSALLANREPLYKYPDASMAVVELRAEGRIRAYRNNQRPLWWAEFENGVIYASTFDSFHRAGIRHAQNCYPYHIYEIDQNGAIIHDVPRTENDKVDINSVIRQDIQPKPFFMRKFK